MADPRLLHIGSAVVDFIYRIDRLPSPGDDLTASAFSALPGGGFNMMVAARRSGTTHMPRMTSSGIAALTDGALAASW